MTILDTTSNLELMQQSLHHEALQILPSDLESLKIYYYRGQADQKEYQYPPLDKSQY